jgi:hypothetical protein
VISPAKVFGRMLVSSFVLGPFRQFSAVLGGEDGSGVEDIGDVSSSGGEVMWTE